MFPHRTVLFDTITPIALYSRLRSFFAGDRLLLFESGVNNLEGNFSYLFVGCEERIWHEDGRSFYQNGGRTEELGENPLTFLKKRFKKHDERLYRDMAIRLEIGFVDGFVGYVGYDAISLFEPVLKSSIENLIDETHTPEIDLIRPKFIFAINHKKHTLTALCPRLEDEALLDRAMEAIREPFGDLPLIKAKKLGEGTLSFGKEEFMSKVLDVKKEIENGEVFQMLLSSRFIQPASIDPFSFYRILRSKNPSPYQFFLPYDRFAIVGCSPELLVGLRNSQILLKPIAGTRPRGGDPAHDLEMEKELLADEKELAEHIMLIDLGRNDIGRVAKAGSIITRNLLHVERFSHVMHIVSDIHGELSDDKDMFDLFASAFTAGTMTGAPKIRAMELIAKFEGTKRGCYSGAIALFGFTGDMDTAITIRSAQIEADRAIFHSGAGIVADSKPENEYREVQNKMAAMLSSFEDLLAI
ncbi:MAG: anthranilate synthase component I family protein [Helicobacteraceae bacterium]|nr:anthranilate synthase component I family protein [Helicobacteraceae bacterium]